MSDIQVIQAHRQIAVDLDGRQLIGEKRLFTMLFKLLGQGFRPAEGKRFYPL